MNSYSKTNSFQMATVACRWLSTGILMLTGCASPLLRQIDYNPSLSSLSTNGPEQALAQFPTGEKHSFITTMEKAYLGLLAGKPETAELQRHASAIDERVRFDVSEDLRHFFYAQTEEGYYASEHEVIWIHLMLGWAYAQRGEYEEAAVEARRSANLLSEPWSSEGEFDDPMLRIFLAALWAQCGIWEDAAVDFRVAARLDPSLAWARELGNMTQPPKHLAIVLGGVGPKTYWSPQKNFNLLRGLRHIGFEHTGLRSTGCFLDAKGRSMESYLSPTSAAWYERHWRRNDAIHDLITDSQYFNRMVGSSSLMAANVGFGVATGTGICLLMVGGGGGLVYLGALAESGELAGLGLLVAVAGTFAGYSYAADSTSDAVDQFKKDMDTSGRYRFVRFLPEYIWVGWSNADLEYPLIFKTAQAQSRAIRPVSSQTCSVSIGYLPDIASGPTSQKNNTEPCAAQTSDDEGVAGSRVVRPLKGRPAMPSLDSLDADLKAERSR